ncbi:MAG: hypothetical protein AAGN82_03665 [Myxococcota bacterium]
MVRPFRLRAKSGDRQRVRRVRLLTVPPNSTLDVTCGRDLFIMLNSSGLTSERADALLASIVPQWEQHFGPPRGATLRRQAPTPKDASAAAGTETAAEATDGPPTVSHAHEDAAAAAAAGKNRSSAPRDREPAPRGQEQRPPGRQGRRVAAARAGAGVGEGHPAAASPPAESVNLPTAETPWGKIAAGVAAFVAVVAIVVWTGRDGADEKTGAARPDRAQSARGAPSPEGVDETMAPASPKATSGGEASPSETTGSPPPSATGDENTSGETEQAPEAADMAPEAIGSAAALKKPETAEASGGSAKPSPNPAPATKPAPAAKPRPRPRPAPKSGDTLVREVPF